MIKILKQMHSSLAGPLVCFQATVAQRHIEKIFLVDVLLHTIGNLIETLSALLVASVSKIISDRGADMRT